MLEKEAAEKERKRAEDEYKAAVLARDSRAVELDNLDKECRKKLQLSCCQYNKALVRFYSVNGVMTIILDLEKLFLIQYLSTIIALACTITFCKIRKKLFLWCYISFSKCRLRLIKFFKPFFHLRLNFNRPKKKISLRNGTRRKKAKITRLKCITF